MRLRAKFISYAARTLLWAFTGPGPFVFLGRKYEIKPTPRGAFKSSSDCTSKQSNRFRWNYTSRRATLKCSIHSFVPTN